MSITKLQLGLTSALAVAGATGFVVQANTAASLRAEADALRQENAAVAPLRAENLQLARLAVEVNEMKRDDAEFARLQQEAAALRQRLQQIARAEDARAAVAKANAVQLVELTKLDQMPRAKFQARPQYPAELRAAGVTGQVVVDFVVDANGDVQKATAVRSTQREFEDAAVAAVSKWKFAAGKKGGADVPTRMQVPIMFSLPNASAPELPTTKTDEKKSAEGPVRLGVFEVRGL